MLAFYFVISNKTNRKCITSAPRIEAVQVNEVRRVGDSVMRELAKEGDVGGVQEIARSVVYFLFCHPSGHFQLVFIDIC